MRLAGRLPASVAEILGNLVSLRLLGVQAVPFRDAFNRYPDVLYASAFGAVNKWHVRILPAQQKAPPLLTGKLKGRKRKRRKRGQASISVDISPAARVS